MSLDALHQPETDKALRAMGELPPPPAAPSARSAWRAVPAFFQGLAAGAVETAAAGAETTKGAGQVSAATGAFSGGGMFSLPSEREQRENEEARAKMLNERIETESAASRALRGAAHDLRPDPATAGTAERLVFDATRLITKAVGYSAVATPVPGAVLTGVDEGMAAADELQRQGVDRNTAAAAGAVQGVAAGVGVVLPVVGNTVGRTLGLYAAGGPGAFMAQQAATREILDRANYGELAQQYDPLDPTGLAVSALFPLPFAAMGLRANLRARVPQEHVDAALTQNLTIQRDAADATAIDDAIRQIDDGVLAVDRELAAARVDVPAGALDEAAPAPGVEPDPAAPGARADGEAAAGDLGAAVAGLEERAAAAARAGVPDDVQALTRSVASRIAEVERMAPDMVVRTGEDGRPVTVADEMAQIRREVTAGTDDALGTADAGLLEVAANCALSLG